MTRKHFIDLADRIRMDGTFTDAQIGEMADFCKSMNSNFNRARWIDYIAGTCGPHGGSR